MKKTIYLFLVLFISTQFSTAFAQSQKNFKENQYLIRGDDYYQTTKNDSTVILYKEKEQGKKRTLANISVSGTDTTYQYKEEKAYEKTAFNITDFPSLKLGDWRGDFKIDKNRIYFYPWSFTNKEDTTLFNSLSEYRYFLEIPERTVVKINFYSYQFGTLTLPVKVFVSSNADSLANNVQTGINLNAFLGVKFGKKKYYYLPHQDKGQMYERSVSLNWVTGFTKIDIKENNTTPKVEEEFSIAGWSNGIALGFHYQSIGLYLTGGVDMPISKLAKDWNFRNKPWVGIGIGLGL